MAFNVSAYPSESPASWGWTHAPVLGATVSGNTIEDSILGGILEVDHSTYIKSNISRVYMSAMVSNNVGIWSASFVNARTQTGSSGSGSPTFPTLTIGASSSNDPGELVASVSGNEVEGPAAAVSGSSLVVVAATVNGQAEVNQMSTLPAVILAAPTGLTLADDNGLSSTDARTSDPRLTFAAMPMAAGYEYSLSGRAGTYLPIAGAGTFTPERLSAGFVTVFVRAYDVVGDRSPDALIVFIFDPSQSSSRPSTSASRITHYMVRIAGASSFVPMGTAIRLTPTQEVNGPPSVQIQLVVPINQAVPEIAGPPQSNQGTVNPPVNPSAAKPHPATTASPKAAPSPGSTAGLLPITLAPSFSVSSMMMNTLRAFKIRISQRLWAVRPIASVRGPKITRPMSAEAIRPRAIHALSVRRWPYRFPGSRRKS